MTRLPAPGRKAQGGPEFSIVISFVLLVFLVMTFLTFQKQDETRMTNLFLDAKKAGSRLAGNINAISKNGDGYYRWFSLPGQLYGSTDYNFTIEENFLSMDYGEGTWASPLLTNNASIECLSKGEDGQNCIVNEEGKVVVNEICDLSDRGCGSVRRCDPADDDNCSSCDEPEPAHLAPDSLSHCESYGCFYSDSPTSEWHFYKVVPGRSGTLSVTFTGTGSMPEDLRSDIIFYDYDDDGCVPSGQAFNIEPQTTESYAVEACKTYIIAIDYDSNCTYGGEYWLETELT